ncbi:SURF1 family protein [Microbacterium immunditiarum]|uniref:SURF1-like protein n=1 Tax=Microbacterium immunditiarum TaxID=337480 RepID=A0A7Y9KK28_9MICO|nr:SURF1 family protein [Microbacterium immunditiarum]NYE20286.1 cytochrome oxidase assembly protein ShyY1 [Microbacterium immunditiarum]
MSLKTARPAVRWTVYVLVAVVFAVTCAFLSNWQFSRNAERAGQLALVERNYDAEPVPLDAAIPSGGELDAGDEWLPVEVVGEYLPDEQLLVRNRAHGGTAAFEVLVPLLTESGRVLVINRGWVPPGSEQRLPDEVPEPPGGEVTVVARLRASEPLPASGRSADEGQVPTIHLPLIAELVDPAISGDVEQSAYGLMATETPSPTLRPQSVEAPSEDPGPHLSYAIQWILFAIMGFVFIGYVIHTERTRRREDAGASEGIATDAASPTAGHAGGSAVEPEAASASPSEGRRQRRRDRDAEDEDAILDAARR